MENVQVVPSLFALRDVVILVITSSGFELCHNAVVIRNVIEAREIGEILN
jgi:hypothetical protein